MTYIPKPTNKECIYCEAGVPLTSKVLVNVKVDGKEAQMWISQETYDKMIAKGEYSNDK